MNGIIYHDPLAKGEESYDEWDDEAVGTTAELGIASSIGGFLTGGSKRPHVQPQVIDHRRSAPGVRDAKLETPRGSANLRLPEEVVSKRAFDEATSNLQDGITKVTARVNSLEQKDLPELKKELGVVLANTRQAIADEMKARKKAMVRLAKEVSNSSQMSMIMGMLSQQQVQTALESHFHETLKAAPKGSTVDPPVALGGGSNNALLLPMLMMGGMGGGGSYRESDNGDSSRESGSDNNMMMMVMMMTLLGPKAQK